MSRDKFLFVTGKLASHSLKDLLSRMTGVLPFDWEINTLPINVAALATTEWINSHLELTSKPDKIIIPGLCRGETEILQNHTGVPCIKGPKDLRDLPDFFKVGNFNPKRSDYGKYTIEIIAEINHAPDLSLDEIETTAFHLASQGADIIDLGMNPGKPWKHIGQCVQRLKNQNFKVSIDSFNYEEVSNAVKAGADLVLSINEDNLEIAKNLECEFVLIPKEPGMTDSLNKCVEKLLSWNRKFRIDPILEPIGHGFAKSLLGYFKTRELYPNIPLMMGTGNVTELTDSDSAGINAILIAICQELSIQSVLTTSVINWCRTSVKEIDLARKLMFHAITNQVIPKRLEPGLLLLRDPTYRKHGIETLNRFKSEIKDKNFRIFAEDGLIHVMNKNIHLKGQDPYKLIEEVKKTESIDESHAFYLGFELCKALTAITLDKNYTQDQELQWGFLTREETIHRNPMVDK
ncbi:MAG: dihydropteroate synthase [Planctomycetes bacterium]|nr:dihydropteroate synthase [Planctomycetota bacterium]